MTTKIMSVKESKDCMVMIYYYCIQTYTQCFISSWIGHDMNVSFEQQKCNIVSISLVFLILSDLNNE